MRPLVNIQMLRPRESLLARVAREGLLPRVKSHVLHQIAVAAEHFSADLTLCRSPHPAVLPLRLRPSVRIATAAVRGPIRLPLVIEQQPLECLLVFRDAPLESVERPQQLRARLADLVGQIRGAFYLRSWEDQIFPAGKQR